VSETLVLEQQDSTSEPLAALFPASRVRFRYGLTIFCGAFLLFQVQLILGKYILPWFGGTPAVWTTCMLFFQLLLLGGYLYAHFLSSKLSARTQAVVHIAVLSVSALVIVLGAAFWKTPLLPGPSWRPTSSDFPVAHILRLLLVAVGLPFLCLSASAPLLQSWLRGPTLANRPTGSTLSRISAPSWVSSRTHSRSSRVSASMSKHGYGAQCICSSLPA